MKIRFLHDWRRCTKGSVVEWDRGVADLLIRRHICEAVIESPKQSKKK